MDETKTRDERIAELLDQPAQTAVSALKGPSLSDVIQEEPKDKGVTSAEGEDEGSAEGDKKVRIRRSRLTALETDAQEKERLLQEALQRIAALESQPKGEGTKDELPDWWKNAYGDDENSRQGYANQQRIMREEMARALQEQERARIQEEQEREQHVAAVEKSFDEQMDALEESIGRDLTDTQKSELLDIVAEYSPQQDGQYVAFMPIEKAYELWQKGDTSAPKQEIAKIAGIQSGQSASPAPSHEPPRWGDWRKRFG